MFMQSNGGLLTDARRFVGKDSILSVRRRGGGRGPRLARRGLRQDHRLRHGRHLDRRVALRRLSTERPRARVRDPGRGRAHARAMMSIHTVAAGGGSILHFDGLALPRRPGLGGGQSGSGKLPRRRPLTVTDCNLYAREIQPNSFLRFRSLGDAPLDGDVVRAKFAASCRRDSRRHGDTRTPSRSRRAS